MDNYVPKEIRRSMRYYQEASPANHSSGNQRAIRFKTEPSEQLSALKHGGFRTEFSKRLAQESSVRDNNHSFKNNCTKFDIPSKNEYKAFIQHYRPTNSGFNFKDLVQRDNFQIISFNNAVYFGEFEGIKQGLGVLLTQDALFEGVFKNDLKFNGSETTYDGVYFGTFNQGGNREGKGKFIWNNGEVYEGDWKDGKKHGQGIWRSPKGDSYEGEWEKGRQHGKGVHKHKSSTYTGEFMRSLKHGRGEESFSNGDNYKGLYELGKPHGKGRYDWNDGSYYEGDFRQGYREGKGMLHEHNGCSYKGSLVANLVKVPLGEISSTVLDKKSDPTAKSSKDNSKRASGCIASLKRGDSLDLNVIVESQKSSQEGFEKQEPLELVVLDQSGTVFIQLLKQRVYTLRPHWQLQLL
jgi:hypothetical protein